MEVPAVPGYRVGPQLAAGGSGSVWRAERLRDGLPVAIKVVPLGPGSLEDTDQAVRELAVLQGVRVEGLVRLHEALALAEPAGTVALVLELVGSGSLTGVIAARGHLSVGEAVTVVCPVARTLAGLHGAGVAHGDVSPANVLIERSGRPVLADLGVARLTGEAPGEVFGTEGFTAPEVEGGDLTSPASDVYALGALAWWCVTGAAPPAAVLRRPLGEVLQDLPTAWVETVERCLAASPDDRPSAAEAALLFFDAAACEPLRLVLGEDEVSLLTRRIRSAGPASQEEPAVASRRLRVRMAIHRARTRARWSRPAAVSASAAGLLGAVVLVAGGAVAERGGPGAAAVHPVQTPATQQSPHRPRSTGSAPGAPADAQRQAVAPSADPVALMGELSRERARVMNSADPAQLRALDLRGSPAWKADAALLEQVRSTGQRFVGVAFSVRTARVLRTSASAASVVAVVDTAAYTVEGPGETVTERPAVRGEEMRFDLRWSGGVWLVERISAQRS